MTSMVFSRVCRAMLGMFETASTSAGRMRWYRCADRLTWEAATPTGAEKPSGNHPSHTENTTSATSPSQNAGVEESR